MRPQKNVFVPIVLITLLSLGGFFVFAKLTATGDYFVSGDVKITGTIVGGPIIEVVNIESGKSILPFSVQPVGELCILTACGGTNVIVNVEGKVVNLGSWSTGPLSITTIKHFSINGINAGSKTLQITVLGDNSEVVGEKSVVVVVQ